MTSCDTLASKSRPPPFSDLKISTVTVMIYTNINFNTESVFVNLPIQSVDTPRSKKQKNIEKRRIVAPEGAIIGTQRGSLFRGPYLRKKKKHWCNVCRPMKFNGTKMKKEMTCTEVIDHVRDDIFCINYFCSRCQKKYTATEMKKISHFLNQTTFVISTGRMPLLHVMLFKDNMKVVGCGDEKDAQDMINLFWGKYLSKNPQMWLLKPGETEPKLVFQTVMQNVDFELGFCILRHELNCLMNETRYRDVVEMSQYEALNNTNVNIKMTAIKPDNFTYTCLTLKKNGFVKSQLQDIPYRNPKKKAVEKPVTFIVFSSSQVILSGRYLEDMERKYDFFVRSVFDHRSLIEEKICKPS
jgi:hypothetical protein